MIRAKGHFWMASRPEWVAEFSLAGAVSSVRPLGLWWAAVPTERWPRHPQMREELLQNWDEDWGDRRQELVFIGAGLDQATLTAQLDACLVQENGNKLDPAWQDLNDPFPEWRRSA